MGALRSIGMSNALAVWDFRVNADGLTYQDIKTGLAGIAKHYVFQLEKGDTGYLHFQGRISLMKKRRAEEKHILLKLFDKWQPNYLAPTTTDNKGNVFYVMKDDTKIEGPYTDKDVDVYIPRQIREITDLRPWQLKIVEDAKKWDTRTINLLFDPNGNNGKSILKTYIGVYGIGRSIPFTNDYKDLMRMVMDTKKMSLYIIDIPRALKKDHMYNFFAGIETLKDGYAYDDRYVFKEEYFDCPNIWVFSNMVPDMSYMSNDRWKLWRIVDGDLKEYDPFAIEESYN